MSTELTRCTGIDHEHRHACALGQRSVAFVELITTAALALSTAVAATAVSIGIARADVVDAVVRGDDVPLAIALCITLLLAAMGGLTAIVARDPRRD